MSTEQVQDRRLQAMEIFRQQKEAVEQRQRQQLIKQMREQEYESRALDAMKEEYISFFVLFSTIIISPLVYYPIAVNDFVVHIQYVKILKRIGQMLWMKNVNVTKTKEHIYLQVKVFLYMSNVININVVLNVNVIQIIVVLQIYGEIHDIYLEHVSWFKQTNLNKFLYS
jgi:hypothetical protein